MKKKTELTLPTNRKEQYWEIFRYHFSEIVLASLETFIFALPLLIWTAFVSYTSVFPSNNLYSTLIVSTGIAISVMILGLGFSGGLYFFKRMIHSEGAIIGQDFLVGIRKNYKDSVKIDLFLGLFYIILQISSASTFAIESLTATNKSIIIGVLYACFILILFISLWMHAQSILYVSSFKKMLANGVKFTFGTLLKSIWIFLLITLPFFTFEFIPFSIAKIITLLVAMIIYFGIMELTLMSYTISIFDKTINAKQYPEIQYKGLNKEKTSISQGEK